ncbi:hypothetical protein B0H15DRAFT_288079 [Mycena belliarum]|uniref:Class E vacuolar protein-sorting machinery protein HSE1 n=1 Tax=Mycena belliarum TaxID=1033014 RepID=A0AAD6XUP9_9AGAR|nr:hypothetical protein B0H15DRAFT_288079 [Mycena belliae]
MFGGASTNPYDEIVVKTTDEHLTSENWELILNLCDKVQDEGPEGAHNVVAALLKRLAHRNPNVQLYTLSLAEALSKNCSIELHREIASRAWTSGLERVVTDRNTHEKVRTRALGLVAMWTAEFAEDSTLGIMQECYDSLKAKNYKYTRPESPPPPAVDDEIRRREEEELQRVLEMSVRDRGGRGAYGGGGASSSTPEYGGGGSSSTPAYGGSAVAYGGSTAASSSVNGAGGSGAGGYGGGGYVPAAQQARERTPSPAPAPAPAAAGADMSGIVTRVRALHPFTPTEAGELGFEKGDVIKVVDRGYRDWWRGQLRGRTGIFPVNYVEPLPEPTPAELAAEAAAEAAVFAQAADVERLLNMLRALDPSKGDNLADDEEIQELYRSSMALRPKIVKLIDKYSQKRADLVSMNETFVRARTIFDRMMEESLARHTGYAQPQGYPQQQQAYPGAQPYGGYPDAAAYQYAQQQQQQPAYGAYSAQGPTPYPTQQQQAHGPSPYPGQQAQPQQAPYSAQGPTPYPAQQGQPQGQQAQGYPAQQQQQVQQQQQAQQPQPQQQAQQVQAQQQQPLQRQQSIQQQQQPTQQQPIQQQPEPQAQAQAQPEPQPQGRQSQSPPAQAGPPYVYDPSTTYADPNVQAWAQYYAAGGKDLAGSVYFISIPGITEPPTPTPAPAPAPAPAAAAVEESQPKPQPQPQVQPHAQSPTLDDDPGYLPDPYANQPAQQQQPEYAQQQLHLPDPYANQPAHQQQPEYAQQQPQQQYRPAAHGTGELAHALGPQSAYQGYALQDPGAGSAQAQAQPQRQGYSLTDPGAGSATPKPASPTASFAPAPGSPVGESTPSWVLPKKSTGAGARAQPAAGLSGQFAGMHV